MNKVNHVPKGNKDVSETGCCPRFDPKGWDGQTFVFENKKFIKIANRCFMHIPIGMGRVMGQAMKQLNDANAIGDEYIMLSNDVSPWRCEHYIAVTKDVPGCEMVELSGTYLSKVFEGPYKDAKSWFTQLQEYAESKGKEPIKTYFYYTTCPKCAKKFGKNYVVGFIQIEG